MGLVAREIEARGIPTLSLTSAWSITQAVGAPRAAFLDFPLGHTAGRAGDAAEQRSILLSALRLFETLGEPGAIARLPFFWSEDDAWKDRVMRPEPKQSSSNESGSSPADDRTARRDEPQYQDERDRGLAEEALAAGGCETCVFPT